MRELKFRVWSKDQKTYDYKFPYNSIGDFYVNTRGKVFSDFGNTVAPEVRQDAFIVERYTGLKDKNGKEIYEGDIVRWSFKVDRNSELTYTSDAVKWESYAEEEWPYSTISGFTLPESEDGYEVIGNVHENPELLNLPGESPPQTDG